MADFDLETFIKSPSVVVFEKCRKADLVLIAQHYGISVTKQSLKKEIRSVVWDRLVELGIFVLPDVQPELEQGGAAAFETPLIEEKEERPQPVNLPRFESLSPASSESVVGARLKICLARLHLEQEANEKQEAREAKERVQKRELEHKLAIRTLEIEAETKLKVRKLELENAATQAVATPTSIRHAPLSEHYDVRRHVALPQFRETEVDAYFNTFERLATALNWPKDIWTTLLQCKLIGKAEDAVATLSLTDSLNYEVVKAAVLRAYELVPEAYRQKFRDYRKALAQSFVEFAREKGTLFDKWCAASKATDYSSFREFILLEEFKKCTPERKRESLSTATKLAMLYRIVFY
ncbi:hypothetical protein SKAU_G00064880 [Synaphobranchus kaupii]|uniref:SCAN box domain-containing protein n=1 Tax=Synaphobranchus kaupii TaxID=118154 RepID=A0A9Q1G5K3_SYNKA|nr:hypothetical protein SKAU_G00064880 [Synaphobranchus kaupii]